MKRITLLQCLLQTWVAADHAAETLLKYSDAIDKKVWDQDLADGAVGDSHKYGKKKII